MRYLSVCSGIEAATQAWHPLGWTPAAFSEIEPFPCAVLAHHYPNVPNWGDMTKFQEWPDADVDVLCGGTPCQSFSVAGLRKGLADPRGNLMLTFGAIAARYRPRWLVWENVPGVLSSNGGRDFGAFLGMLGQLGYGVAYRVLDAQHVRTRRFPHAVPQRRRRVFVVGYLGDWRRAAAVLFDRESLSGHPAPRREAGKGLARGFECGPQGGGFTDLAPTLDARCKDGPIRNQLGAGVLEVPQVSMCLNAGAMGRIDGESETFIPVAHALRGEGFDASEDGTGRGTPIVPVATLPINTQIAMRHEALGESTGFGIGSETDPAFTLTKGHSHAVAIQERPISENPDAGPDGVGARQDGAAYTLEARQVPQAVAFDAVQITSSTNRSIPQTVCPTMAKGSRMHMMEQTVARQVSVSIENETLYPNGVRQKGDADASAQEANAGTLLRALRDQVGEEAFAQWGLGILDTLQSSKVLQSEVHGSGVRCSADDWSELDDNALPRQKDRSSRAVQSLWVFARKGCAPQGWRPSEQLARELGAHLSILSQQRASAARFMLNLWDASEGIGVLRQALSKVQEARRPAGSEGKPAQPAWQVRRLTPMEAERLMGFPDGFTRIPYRNKPAEACPDGPRYKALGNSWAVNCAEWIGERMAEVETWT